MKELKFVHHLSSAHPLEEFEWCHPESLRWDLDYKKQVYHSPNSHFIWLKNGRKSVGEIVMTWESSNVVHGDSISILPKYQGEGYGRSLAEQALSWAREKGFQWFIGEARKGASWNLYKSLGAVKMLDYYNWGGTNETYVLFKIKL